MTSPIPNKTKPKLMNFMEALNEVISGHRITKQEWDDRTIFICLREEKLQIFWNEKFADLILSEADIKGEDWMCLPKEAQA